MSPSPVFFTRASDAVQAAIFRVDRGAFAHGRIDGRNVSFFLRSGRLRDDTNCTKGRVFFALREVVATIGGRLEERPYGFADVVSSSSGAPELRVHRANGKTLFLAVSASALADVDA